MNATRRSFLSATAVGAFAVGCRRSEATDEVTPTEDLMREHGVLRRVMYLYDEAIARLAAKHEVPLDAVAQCAAMIRRVIEDYHEKLEEQQLFPRFESAGRLVGLVTTLRRQHQVGRSITDEISTLSKTSLDDSDRDALASALRRFNHMYRAHAAREDTVLFPALRGLVGPAAYRELGDTFEDQESQVLGERGFEHAVADVARLELAFGVADLAELTASV